MKKIIFSLILILTVILIGTKQIGAKMNEQITQVRAQHILVSTEDEALKIKSDIDSNKITFEDAAKAYSKCPSKANGGDLGYFGRGMMVKEFEDASFNAEKNTITAPVQTSFGWHLIKVTDKK